VRQKYENFCVDIRHEVGRKASFMGFYQGELFVSFVPMMLSGLHPLQ
jgi:hypothetical protein